VKNAFILLSAIALGWYSHSVCVGLAVMWLCGFVAELARDRNDLLREVIRRLREIERKK